MASYFASIVKVSLDKNIGTQKLSPMCTLPKFNQKTLYFMSATSYDIHDIISNLKNKNSSGVGKTPKILKFKIGIEKYQVQLKNIKIKSLIKTGKYIKQI